LICRRHAVHLSGSLRRPHVRLQGNAERCPTLARG
jgi:hypothetical protein